MRLYHQPGACSRVTMTALEQIGNPFEDELVSLGSGQQNSVEYRAINPKGKVPALVVDGQLISENGAILWWLHQNFPAAGLFPEVNDNWSQAMQISDLFWLSSGWHPAVRANRAPTRWTTGDIEPVKERGRELLNGPIAQLENRLQCNDWWYGDHWSILDVYFCWNYSAAEEGGYSLAGLESIAAHRKRVEALPAFQRALAREQAAEERVAK
ncbi:glutathione S-transferase family protein [Parasphingorhabdus sp.]|uniref:glutathione S-transferase family protein n=1 Tax=Parasphingorhabdus sp. TaxID=2709688 RepID=UPI003A94BAFF